MNLNTMIMHHMVVLSQDNYPHDQINMTYVPPKKFKNTLLHNFSFNIIESLKKFQSSMDLLIDYSENNFDEVNKNNVHNELLNVNKFANEYLLINNNIEIDDDFCANIIQGNEEQSLMLMETYYIDPFKFNKKYQTNPINLAYLNNSEKIIKKIKDLVYTKKIPYDFNFYCPNWNLRNYYSDFITFQIKVFESIYHTLIQAFWSDETKEWVEL